MNKEKRKEIVDFALGERIGELESACDIYKKGNNDLIGQIAQKDRHIANLEKQLVVEASSYALRISGRNTLRDRVAELETAKEALKARLAAVKEDRDKLRHTASKQADCIHAATNALKS